MSVTIYHNPACGTSRTVLAAIRATGQEPTIIQYLKTPPSRAELASLIDRMGRKPSTVMRWKGDLPKELGLDVPGVSEDQILDAMAEYPILIERPIVVTSRGVALCRPADALKTVLPDAAV